MSSVRLEVHAELEDKLQLAVEADKGVTQHAAIDPARAAGTPCTVHSIQAERTRGTLAQATAAHAGAGPPPGRQAARALSSRLEAQLRLEPARRDDEASHEGN